jgi:predicted permease
VLFGMLPAFATRKVDLRSQMTSRAVGGTRHQRVRQVLIAGEVALTVVLLAACGLLIRTLMHLEMLPPGFNPEGVMTAKASLDDVRFQDPARFRAVLDKSTAAMGQIPGVEAAAVGLSLPYERALNGGVTLSDGREAGQQVMAGEVYVTPEYFRALQIPILLGRSFNDGDGAKSAHVAIVNRTFMSKFYHGENPVGRYVDKDTRIVGVVADVMMAPGIDPVAPLAGEQTMYIPATQMDPRALAMVHVWFQPSWIVRRAGPVEGLTEQMQRALSNASPNLPFSGFYSMRDLQAKTLAAQRVEVALLGVMAALALLLSAVGIFALVASVAGQKRHEVGIRIALGSTIRQAMVHVGLPGVRASMWGLMLGLALCAGCLRTMQSVLYAVRVYDASTLLAVVGVLAVVTMVAAAVPTLRIAGIDPAKTLREE